MIFDKSDVFDLKIVYSSSIENANSLAKPNHSELTSFVFLGVKNGQAGIESSFLRVDTVLFTETRFIYSEFSNSIA